MSWRRPKKYVPERVTVTAGPVTVTRLQVVTCSECKRRMAHKPGEAAKILTDHYRAAHGVQ